MTKQDIQDIIYLLETHFEAVGKEVRDEVEFQMTEDDSNFFTYDNESLFRQWDENDNEYQAASYKSNLKIRYTDPHQIPLELGARVVDYTTSGVREILNIPQILEAEIKNNEFHLKTYHLLSQEFKVVVFKRNGGEIRFVILDSEEVPEGVNLKKFNQF